MSDEKQKGLDFETYKNNLEATLKGCESSSSPKLRNAIACNNDYRPVSVFVLETVLSRTLSSMPIYRLKAKKEEELFQNLVDEIKNSALEGRILPARGKHNTQELRDCTLDNCCDAILYGNNSPFRYAEDKPIDQDTAYTLLYAILSVFPISGHKLMDFCIGLDRLYKECGHEVQEAIKELVYDFRENEWVKAMYTPNNGVSLLDHFKFDNDYIVQIAKEKQERAHRQMQCDSSETKPKWKYGKPWSDKDIEKKSKSIIESLVLGQERIWEMQRRLQERRPIAYFNRKGRELSSEEANRQLESGFTTPDEKGKCDILVENLNESGTIQMEYTERRYCNGPKTLHFLSEIVTAQLMGNEEMAEMLALNLTYRLANRIDRNADLFEEARREVEDYIQTRDEVHLIGQRGLQEIDLQERIAFNKALRAFTATPEELEEMANKEEKMNQKNDECYDSTLKDYDSK